MPLEAHCLFSKNGNDKKTRQHFQELVMGESARGDSMLDALILGRARLL